MFDTHYKFTGRWFRQITPLGIWNARLLGTNDIPKAPRFTHALGALGPMPQAAPHLFQRAAEVALGVSFNAQSQAPDIPGASSRVVISRHTFSFQAHSKAPDKIPLRAFMEEVLASFNTQARTPDRQWTPCIFVEKPRHCSPVPPRSPTKHDIPTISLQLDSPDCAQELFKRILISSYLGVSELSFSVVYGFYLLALVWFVSIVSVLDVLGFLR